MEKYKNSALKVSQSKSAYQTRTSCDGASNQRTSGLTSDLPSPPLPRTSTYRASSSPLFLETSLAGRETTDGQEEEKEDEPLVKVQLTHVEHGEREGEEDGEAGDNEEESGIPAPGRRIHRGLIGNERAEKSRKKLPTRMMKTLEN